MISLYISERTWLHRLPASFKLGMLVSISIAILFVDGWRNLLPALAAALCMVLSLGRPGLQRLQNLRGLLLLVFTLGVFQGLVMSWDLAASAVIRILLMVILADLVTVTTPMQKMLAVITPLLTPFKPLGVAPHRLALAVALVIRFVPLLMAQWQAQRLAYRARSARRPRPVLLVSFLAQALRRTDQIADSLSARQVRSR